MIRLNKEKRAIQKEFLDWLVTTLRILTDKEGRQGIDVLTGKAKLTDYSGDYQKNEPSLTTEELLDILRKNKNHLGMSLSDANLVDRIKKTYEGSLQKVLPLKERLARTDKLIDQVVYRLYGLTEEEIGVVEGIVGIHHYEVTVRGFANHAGTTPMDRRRNALLAASEIVLAVDRIVRSVPGRQVGTVGRLVVRPGAPNVIPGEVSFTIELRDLKTETIESLWSRIEPEARAQAERRGCTMEYALAPPDRPALSDPRLRDLIRSAADGLGLRHQDLPSGAGHDAQELARIAPMGMIFIPSVGGISHSPRELSRREDIGNGANVLLQTVLRLDQGALD